MDQARDYAKEIKKSGRVNASTDIEVFVLGAMVDPELEEATQGNIVVKPMVYDTVLRKADARTFNLQRKLKEILPPPAVDRDLEEVLGEEHTPLFDGTG